MAHNIEMGANGEAAIAAVGAPMWHKLGTVFADRVTTTEMMSAAYLSDWNVRVEPWDLPNGYRSDKEYSRIIRTNPFDGGIDVLGQGLPTYIPMQNEDLALTGDAITAGGADPESAGSLKSGRITFLSWKLPEDMFIDPAGSNDRIQTYLMLSTSHDGSQATRASVVTCRPVWWNTYTLALAGAKTSISIRHTKNSPIAIEDARKSLGMAFTYMDKFQQEVEALIHTEMTQVQVVKAFETVYAMPDKEAGKAAMTKWEAKQDALMDIYTSPTCVNIAGTAWGVYSALTEQLDYGTKSRKGNGETALIAGSGFDANRNAKRNGLLDVVKQVAMV